MNLVRTLQVLECLMNGIIQCIIGQFTSAMQWADMNKIDYFHLKEPVNLDSPAQCLPKWNNSVIFGHNGLLMNLTVSDIQPNCDVFLELD